MPASHPNSITGEKNRTGSSSLLLASAQEGSEGLTALSSTVALLHRGEMEARDSMVVAKRSVQPILPPWCLWRPLGLLYRGLVGTQSQWGGPQAGKGFSTLPHSLCSWGALQLPLLSNRTLLIGLSFNRSAWDLCYYPGSAQLRQLVRLIMK